VEAERTALCNERDEFIRAEKDAFFTKDNWQNQTECRSNNQQAKIMLSASRDILRVVCYHDDFEFSVVSDVAIPISAIFAIELKNSEVLEKYLRTELVPIVSSKNKSVVGRAVAGNLVFGPVGAVIGGVSGAKADISTKIEERKVEDERIRKGAPVLVIGTTHPDHPILKLSFASESSTEQWEYRLKAAKAANN
jgi:hypothetical protein